MSLIRLRAVEHLQTGGGCTAWLNVSFREVNGGEEARSGTKVHANLTGSFASKRPFDHQGLSARVWSTAEVNLV